ncbi:MAG TPA: hypothetical protein VF587_06750 [Solirubrobacteraceae bacterium]
MTAQAPPLAGDVLEVLDEAVRTRAVVFGSLPPRGRDVDLLVRSAEHDAVGDALRAAGFERDDRHWIRFSGRTACCVELERAEGWGLPAPALDALFDESVAIDGHDRVRRPSPHHQLLLLARQTSGAAAVPAKKRRRAHDALAEDPEAWAKAEALAADWGVGDALGRLRAAVAGDAPVARRTLRGAVGRARSVLRPRVVALSGIDGSGKSTQAKALQDALHRLGHDAEIAWAPLAHDALLARIGPPLKRAVRRLTRSSGPVDPPPGVTAAAASPASSASEPRPLPRVVKVPWLALVAASNVATHRRQVARHAAHGRVVIFDRYTLDSAARLRFFFWDGRLPGLLNRLITLLSPRPLCTFFLDLDPEDSLARKDDGWSLAELDAQARLYREELERSGAIRLDATRPGDELAAEIAREVWRRLR